MVPNNTRCLLHERTFLLVSSVRRTCRSRDEWRRTQMKPADRRSNNTHDAPRERGEHEREIGASRHFVITVIIIIISSRSSSRRAHGALYSSGPLVMLARLSASRARTPGAVLWGASSFGVTRIITTRNRRRMQSATSCTNSKALPSLLHHLKQDDFILCRAFVIKTFCALQAGSTGVPYTGD